jgi:hypothetical protein
MAEGILKITRTIDGIIYHVNKDSQPLAGAMSLSPGFRSPKYVLSTIFNFEQHLSFFKVHESS